MSDLPLEAEQTRLTHKSRLLMHLFRESNVNEMRFTSNEYIKNSALLHILTLHMVPRFVFFFSAVFLISEHQIM